MKKKLSVLTSVLLIAGGTALATAAPLPDVPHGHWAASAVQSTYQKKIMTGQPDGKFHGEQPVSRYELAVVLDRFIHYIEAGRKPLHPAAPQKAAAVPAGAGPAVKAAFVHLSRGGFLAPTSPILQGKGTEVVTAQQLSDALAQITIRLSDRSLPPMKD